MVWLDPEVGSGELRAVKDLAKLQVNVPEEEIMLEFHDVSLRHRYSLVRVVQPDGKSAVKLSNRRLHSDYFQPSLKL